MPLFYASTSVRVLVSLLRTRQLKVPRKGGPGITQADVLVVNKVDLAPAVGADLDVMRRDARKMRGAGPTVFASVKHGDGLDAIIGEIFAAQRRALAAAAE